MALDTLLQDLKNDNRFMANVSHWHSTPFQQGIYGPIPDQVHPRLVGALEKRGIDQLYSHQISAWQAFSNNNHGVVVTPTASGKTLCYNLPVMDAILRAPESRALYLFPTKALSQDQQAELNEVALGGDLDVKIATFDGDTPTSLRASARNTGQIVITNPDMLHSGVLPNHPKWIRFFKNLKYVVIDELHSYRGIFGSHMALLMARLRRIAGFYGAEPTFICCSATIANPAQLAQEITGLPQQLIDNNGAPRGERHLILYNPPLVDPVQGIRRGTVSEAQRWATELLPKGAKTIVFARSRVRVELIASYIRQNLANLHTDNRGVRVESYRGGYLPSERRAIEQGLRDGAIHCVVSTNALELGIDIGSLDLAILAGFPGSVASFWQQAGRAGRRASASAVIAIASSSPMDQFLAQNPDFALQRNPEEGRVNRSNSYIVADQIKCAVFELPMAPDDPFIPNAEPYLELLREDGNLRFTGERYHWSDRSYPADQISLRSSTSENVVIVDTTKGAHRVLGEMDVPSAKELIFPKAVYIHRGDQYMVLNLDLEERTCFVEASTLNYYTDGIVKRDIKVLQVDHEDQMGSSSLAKGDILVRSQVTKFKKLMFRTHENIGYGDIFLPEEEMHTRSLMVSLPVEGDHGLPGVDDESQGTVLARLGTLISRVAPAFVLCDAQDLGVSERLRDPFFQRPTLYLFDRYPGGTGLAEGLADQWDRVLAAAQQVVTSCPCREGCPSCIGPRDHREIGSNPKDGVVSLLSSLGAPAL